MKILIVAEHEGYDKTNSVWTVHKGMERRLEIRERIKTIQITGLLKYA